LVVLCLAKNPSPGREEGGSVVDGLVYCAHVRFGFFERSVDAFDHFVDFAHPLELGLQARVSRLVCIVAVFYARRLICRSAVVGSVFLGGCAALGTRKQVFFVFVLQAQTSYVGSICEPRHFRLERLEGCFERVVSRLWVLALGWLTLFVCVLLLQGDVRVSDAGVFEDSTGSGSMALRESERKAGARMELIKLT
jgi:hypothetical protein